MNALTAPAPATLRRRPAAGIVVLALAASVAWAGSSPTAARAALPPLDHAAVLSAIPGVVAAGAPAFLMHGVDEAGDWSAAAGVANLKTGTPASPDAAFRIGSISKTFVAVAILQLVAEGNIGLDEPVATYLPGLLARGDVITIRELLQHRSGLGTTGFGNGHGNSWFPAINAGCKSEADPVSQIKAADVQLFEPGTAYNYANAGYTTLGLVIERVTGRPYADVLRDRITIPLGPTRTSFQDGVPVWPDPYVRGYGDFLPGAIWHKNYTDETDCTMKLFGAAGSGISTTRDLTTFLRALTGGRLLPDDLYRQMIDTLPTAPGSRLEYGLGIVRLTGPCGGAVDLLGHDGAVMGYSTDLWTTVDGSRTFASVLPLYPGTDAMWAAVNVVFRAELCGTGG